LLDLSAFQLSVSGNLLLTVYSEMTVYVYDA